MTRIVSILALAAMLTACGVNTSNSSGGTGKILVVAAENFWGSIAAQVGGADVQVSSIIVNPDTDPHAYEATPSDARLIAQAQYVIVNGAGYDAWAPKLLDANPASGRTVLTVADLFGKTEGDNPHVWYSRSYVDQIVDRIGSDLAKIDSADGSTITQQAAQYKSAGLKDYHDTIDTIKQKYAGTKVGATESIAAYLTDGTGLTMVTPSSYLKAISEGTDPSASDKAEVQNEIATRSIKIFIFNSQNSTPDIQGLVDKATAQGIPVLKITETLAPATATFQDWQTAQLKDLLRGLGG
jgi:zinc/manganese transport system substrate-binding protein